LENVREIGNAMYSALSDGSPGPRQKVYCPKIFRPGKFSNVKILSN